MDINAIEGIKVAEKLWDLANLVTGFAVVQSIATTFAIAKGELRGSLRGPVAHRVAFSSTIVFTIFYLCAIVLCHNVGSSHDSRASSSIWLAATLGRVLAVLLFTVVTLGTLCCHRRDELIGKRPGDSKSE